jgi:hypothetical protein
VQLANGEILPEGFTQVCHGHAVTSHKSQGASVQESMLVLGPVSLGSGAVDLRQFYVSNTRFKEDHTLFTSNLKRLKAKVGKRNERMLAREFLAGLGKELETLLTQAKRLDANDGSAADRSARIRKTLREVERQVARAKGVATRRAILDQLGIRNLPDRFMRYWRELGKRRRATRQRREAPRNAAFVNRFRRGLRVYRWYRRSVRNVAYRKAAARNKPAALRKR